MRSRPRSLVAALCTLLLAVFGVTLLVASPASAGTATVTTTGDAYTSQSSPTGTHPTGALNVNSGSTSERRGHVMFPVTGIPAGATGVHATLRLWAQQGDSTHVYTVSAEASTWTEAGITWNNQPALGAQAATRTGLVNSAYNDFDVSTAVTGNGTVAFAVRSNDASTQWFNSRESASGKPQLVVTWTDPAAGNTAPTVNAGPDQAVTLPAAATLAGSVTDDGQPNPPGTTTATWSQVSGPGTATFANPAAASTTATFSAAGTYVLRLTGSDSALSSTDDVTVTVTASGGGGTGAFGVKVSGNQLVSTVDGATPVQLRGVNRSGTEYACSEGWGLFDGPVDNASLTNIRDWGGHANTVDAVRVSLNEDCWVAADGTYTGAAYRSAVTDYVNRLTALGVYVIVDEHGHITCSGSCNDQRPMPTEAKTPIFWGGGTWSGLAIPGVAATLKGNPAVVFDLFNEPYPNSNTDSAAAWQCVRDGTAGGTCTGVTYTAAGMQELLTAVRNTGSTNVVMVGGPQYAGVLDSWLTYKPVDPAGQLAASVHIYYDTPASPEWSPCYLESCWNSQILPVAAQVPVVIGEVGEHDCSFGLINGTQMTPAQDSLVAWAEKYHVGYLAWSWIASASSCASGPTLISAYSGTANASYGTGYQSWLWNPVPLP